MECKRSIRNQILRRVGWILMQVAGTLKVSLILPEWLDSVITAGLSRHCVGARTCPTKCIGYVLTPNRKLAL
jgi:hypothetical protein